MYNEMATVGVDVASTADNAVPALRQIAFDSGSVSAQAQNLAEAVVDALTRPLTETEQISGEWSFAPEKRYLSEGNYEEVRNAMEGDLTRCTTTLASAQFTDGSPVALPTEASLAAMLAGTSFAPGTIIGPIQPNNTFATVESVAIQGIMAGLKSETMPLLLALTECMSKTHDFGSTLGGADGWFAFGTVVSGPAATEMKINTGGPANGGPAPFTVGVPTNTGIGRFIRLVQVNIGGTEAGIFEAKGIGHPAKTSIVVAEATDEVPWGGMSSVIAKNPLGGDWETFARNESTVSLFVMWGDMMHGINGTNTSPALPTAAPAGYTTQQWGARTTISGMFQGAKWLNRPQQGLVLFISPSRARTLSNAGVTREVAARMFSDFCTDANSVARANGLGSGVVGAGFTVQGENLHSAWGNGFWMPPNSGDNASAQVKYFPNPKLINFVVGPSNTYGHMLMNGLPRWTASIDEWR
jgi:hypothetical protein